MSDHPNTEIPTGPQIAKLMLKGGLYALVLFTFVLVSIWFLWWIGETFLPRDVDAFLPAVIQQATSQIT